jgi:hypothetical protein
MANLPHLVRGKGAEFHGPGILFNLPGIFKSRDGYESGAPSEYR